MWRWISAAAPVLIYAAIIVAISGQSTLPSTRIWDKAAHFGEYLILGLLIARAVHLISGWSGLRSAITAISLATAFAITDEIHQYFVPGRDADALDVLADFLGSVFGSALYMAWLQLLARLRPAAASNP